MSSGTDALVPAMKSSRGRGVGGKLRLFDSGVIVGFLALSALRYPKKAGCSRWIQYDAGSDHTRRRPTGRREILTVARAMAPWRRRDVGLKRDATCWASAKASTTTPVLASSAGLEDLNRWGRTLLNSVDASIVFLGKASVLGFPSFCARKFWVWDVGRKAGAKWSSPVLRWQWLPLEAPDLHNAQSADGKRCGVSDVFKKLSFPLLSPRRIQYVSLHPLRLWQQGLQLERQAPTTVVLEKPDSVEGARDATRQLHVEPLRTQFHLGGFASKTLGYRRGRQVAHPKGRERDLRPRDGRRRVQATRPCESTQACQSCSLQPLKRRWEGWRAGESQRGTPASLSRDVGRLSTPQRILSLLSTSGNQAVRKERQVGYGPLVLETKRHCFGLGRRRKAVRYRLHRSEGALVGRPRQQGDASPQHRWMVSSSGSVSLATPSASLVLQLSSLHHFDHLHHHVFDHLGVRRILLPLLQPLALLPKGEAALANRSLVLAQRPASLDSGRQQRQPAQLVCPDLLRFFICGQPTTHVVVVQSMLRVIDGVPVAHVMRIQLL
eukprot:scaffold4635_cov267-Pinguiococcus_pyrenoidosus.AAC.31